MCRGRIWIWGELLGLIDVIALIVWTRTRTSAELYESENVFLGRLLGWGIVRTIYLSQRGRVSSCKSTPLLVTL